MGFVNKVSLAIRVAITLSTYINGFLDAGFIIERVIDPTITEEQLASYPELDDEVCVPNFIIYVLQKPRKSF